MPSCILDHNICNHGPPHTRNALASTGTVQTYGRLDVSCTSSRLCVRRFTSRTRTSKTSSCSDRRSSRESTLRCPRTSTARRCSCWWRTVLRVIRTTDQPCAPSPIVHSAHTISPHARRERHRHHHCRHRRRLPRDGPPERRRQARPEVDAHHVTAADLSVTLYAVFCITAEVSKT